MQLRGREQIDDRTSSAMQSHLTGLLSSACSDGSPTVLGHELGVLLARGILYLAMLLTKAAGDFNTRTVLLRLSLAFDSMAPHGGVMQN